MTLEMPVYRPPTEADTLLLTVTQGCAHNRCTFCTMYRNKPFAVRSSREIEIDLREARAVRGPQTRIFLLDGDAFTLSAARLLAIAKLIQQFFPDCRTISMYASIRDIAKKSNGELADLRDAGIGDLYVGIESGNDDVVARINKGHTVDEARQQLARLDQAGITFIANLMLGIGGRDNGIANARSTAAFLNATRPRAIWVGTLALFPGGELHAAAQAGTFRPATERENLEEERELIDQLDLQDVRFYGTHPGNAVRVFGLLPQDKQLMLETVHQALNELDPAYLSSVAERASL